MGGVGRLGRKAWGVVMVRSSDFIPRAGEAVGGFTWSSLHSTRVTALLCRDRLGGDRAASGAAIWEAMKPRQGTTERSRRVQETCTGSNAQDLRWSLASWAVYFSTYCFIQSSDLMSYGGGQLQSPSLPRSWAGS